MVFLFSKNPTSDSVRNKADDLEIIYEPIPNASEKEVNVCVRQVLRLILQKDEKQRRK